ncbi:DNA primase [Candidatus Geothermarchaeota archaeon]|nr:MAG: DNA primase [Candidatus Geothermarchaeota archaeon]HEW93542.1 toprim domain-containing protein [Thermoprotei archaeon]
MVEEYSEEEKEYIKYIIEFEFEIDGVVEKSDIVGAIFGQTEGIFGPTFDLRELAKAGKIGRITPVHMEVKDRRTVGILRLTTTKEIEAAALIAALVESVDQVGPYKAKFKFKRLYDVREEKIKRIVKRALDILESWRLSKVPKAEEILDTLRKHMQNKHIMSVKIGKEKLAAGPGIKEADEIILVEGRADVANLVKYGITNVLSIGGGRIPEEIVKLVKGKKVTAFLDGDRGGLLNLKKLLQTLRIDYVAMAPEGKEVEDLKYDEIKVALENKKPIGLFLIEERDDIRPYKKYIEEVYGKLEAALIKDGKIKDKVPISELISYLERSEEELDTIVLDGIITQRLIDLCSKKGIKTIVGLRKGSIVRIPEGIRVLSLE